MTITEALAELKTIQKRIANKRDFVKNSLGRPEFTKDPFEKQGGAAVVLGKELQAIRDLEQRTIELRRNILATNLETKATVRGSTRSIQDWLTWRREVSGGAKIFLDGMVQGIRGARTEAQKRGVAVVENGKPAANPNDLVLHVNETEIFEARETVDAILGELDGQLSVVNATTQLVS